MYNLSAVHIGSTVFFMRGIFKFSAFALSIGVLSSAAFAEVAMQNGTGTFSQTFDFPWLASEIIDGDSTPNNGWAIFRPGVGTLAETAVFETVTDLTAPALSIDMIHTHANQGHMSGRFRWSYTTDNRNDFADGLQTNGDVTANWTVMTPTSVTAPSGMTPTILGDGSVRMAGNSGVGNYNLLFGSAVAGVTGFRLEMLEDSLLPSNGPGLFPTNGNFVLNEVDVQVVPEPATMIALGVGALLAARRRNRR